MTRYVALLRAINVGKRKVPMADLKAIAGELGLGDVRTYVASGNLLFESDQPPAKIEADLEKLLQERFGFTVEVMVRSQAQWAGYVRSNPMPDESAASPNLVMVNIGKRAATDEDVDQLRSKASGNERVERVVDVVWLYFGNGAARSKLGLNPAKGIWTARNWRSLLKIQELLAA